MRETVAILRGAWGPGTFSHTGKIYRYDNVNVTPKPAHPIPIWLGGFAPAAIERAGRIADGFLGSSTGTSGIDAFAQAKQIALAARGDDAQSVLVRAARPGLRLGRRRSVGAGEARTTTTCGGSTRTWAPRAARKPPRRPRRRRR